MKMKKFLVLCLFILCCAGALAGCRSTSEPPARTANPAKAVFRPLRLVAPANSAYTGAYIDFGETEDDVSLEAIEDFQKLVGKEQAIVASSNYWSKKGFPSRNMRIISAYGAIPLLFWSPWDRKEYEDTKFNRYDLRLILAGRFDSYIDAWAAQAKEFGLPLLVAWGIEMNGNWFPWSGIFHGGGRVIEKTEPPVHEGPDTYRKAFRYIVERVRAKGAGNIEWVFHVNNTSDPYEPWNSMSEYYPGSAYVDWLALSAYGQQFPFQEWISFDFALPGFYRELCAVDTAKPIMLAEWGVANFPQKGKMSDWLAEAFRRLPTDFPRLKAAVYWHERWQNGDGSISNLRVNATDQALSEYREGVADSFWLGRPQFIAK